MPKSRNRGGAKTHRKRVKNRNEQIENMQRYMQKRFEEELERLRLEEEMKKQEEGIPSDEINPETYDENKPLDIKI